MTKLQAIQIIKLLSAMESWAMAHGHRIPDYMHEQLSAAIEFLEEEVLK